MHALWSACIAWTGVPFDRPRSDPFPGIPYVRVAPPRDRSHRCLHIDTVETFRTLRVIN